MSDQNDDPTEREIKLVFDTEETFPEGFCTDDIDSLFDQESEDEILATHPYFSNQEELDEDVLKEIRDLSPEDFDREYRQHTASGAFAEFLTTPESTRRKTLLMRIHAERHPTSAE